MSIRDQVGRALRFVRSERTVATLIGIGFGNSFAFGAVLGLLVPYAVTELGLADVTPASGCSTAPPVWERSWPASFFGRLFRTERIRWLTPGTLAFSVVDGGRRAGRRHALGAGRGAARGLLVVDRHHHQRRHHVPPAGRPDDLRSSVNVLGRMISWGGQPFGAACGALVAGAASVPVAYVGAAVVMGVSGLVAAILLNRGGRSTALATPMADDPT